jgi:hypothetical protein
VRPEAADPVSRAAVVAGVTVTQAHGGKLFGYSGVSGDLTVTCGRVAWVGNWILSDDGAVVCCRRRSRGGRPTTAIVDITRDARRVSGERSGRRGLRRAPGLGAASDGGRV